MIKVKTKKQSDIVDKAIVSAMMIESIIIAFSIREDMFLTVALGALVIIGLRATKKVLNDWL